MKKQIAYVIAATMAISAAVPIMAADNIKTRDAQLRSDFTIVVDGKEVGFRSADGEAVYPVLYNGSTYLPLRAVGELMGKNVNWDEENKTVTLSGTRTTASKNGINAKHDKKTIRIQERPDFTIVVDNKEKTFKSATGREIHPILYNGSTYLPLRSIGEIMDQDVVWDGKAKKITLGARETVTDADSFLEDHGIDPKDIITREKAKEIALDHSGFTPSQVKFVKANTEMDKGVVVYNLKFYAGDKEYNYTIDAKTGKVLSYDSNNQKPGDSDLIITREKAKEIALDHAGLLPSQVKFVKANTEMENGILVYDLKFYAGNKEYDYEIDAKTGKILSYDVDTHNQKPENPTQTITREKAKEIALDHAGLLPSQVTFVKAKQDMEDGILVYEIEFYAGNKEYDYEIDAKTGKILSYDFDAESYTPPVNRPENGKITLEKAKEIALRHLGLNDGSVHFTKTKQEFDDGTVKYEIEFYANGMEHEFEISASGKILEYSADDD